MRWNRTIPIFAMGALAILYVLVRPLLAPRVWHLEILEYPVGALIVAVLILVALRRPRASRPDAAPAWRKHAQVVRALDDPEMARHLGPLESWARSGRDAPAAARVIAQAQGDVQRAPQIESLLSRATSERKRRALLTEMSRTQNPGA